MKDDSKFWEIVDGVEISSKKIKFKQSLFLIISQTLGLILLFAGLVVTPLLGVLGFIVALVGLNRHLVSKRRG